MDAVGRLNEGMDAVERLTPEQVSAPTLLALTHVHRYQLATALCSGKRVLDLCCGSGYGSAILAARAGSVLGVDSHAPSIERACNGFRDQRVRFERGDAHDYLDRELAREFDAIVLLEGLEHLPDPARAVERLRGHAEAGMTLIVSLPNSVPFGEQNPHHVSEFDFESATAAFARLPNAQVLYQFHAEGSLICEAPVGDLDTQLNLSERADAEHCNHFIAVVNAEPEAVRGSSRMQLAVAPAFNRYMLDLERENRQLWRTNQRLARGKLAQADAAAATVLRGQAGAEERLPGRLETAAAVGTRVARKLSTILLSILPHALTMVLLRIRARLREDRPE